jgi:protein involved in temperature-dependent protein secretion
LKEAACWRPILWKAWPMLAFATLVSDDQRAASLYSRWIRGKDIVERLLTGRLKPGALLSKVRQIPQRARTAARDSRLSTLSLTDSALAPFEHRST